MIESESISNEWCCHCFKLSLLAFRPFTCRHTITSDCSNKMPQLQACPVPMCQAKLVPMSGIFGPMSAVGRESVSAFYYSLCRCFDIGHSDKRVFIGSCSPSKMFLHCADCGDIKPPNSTRHHFTDRLFKSFSGITATLQTLVDLEKQTGVGLVGFDRIAVGIGAAINRHLQVRFRDVMVRRENLTIRQVSEQAIVVEDCSLRLMGYYLEKIVQKFPGGSFKKNLESLVEVANWELEDGQVGAVGSGEVYFAYQGAARPLTDVFSSIGLSPGLNWPSCTVKVQEEPDYNIDPIRKKKIALMFQDRRTEELPAVERRVRQQKMLDLSYNRLAFHKMFGDSKILGSRYFSLLSLEAWFKEISWKLMSRAGSTVGPEELHDLFTIYLKHLLVLFKTESETFLFYVPVFLPEMAGHIGAEDHLQVFLEGSLHRLPFQSAHESKPNSVCFTRAEFQAASCGGITSKKWISIKISDFLTNKNDDTVLSEGVSGRKSSISDAKVALDDGHEGYNRARKFCWVEKDWSHLSCEAGSEPILDWEIYGARV